MVQGLLHGRDTAPEGKIKSERTGRKMIEYDVFPNMYRKCVIFSFKTGYPNDERLRKLINKYQVKATFSEMDSNHYSHVLGQTLPMGELFLNIFKHMKEEAILHISGSSNELKTEENWDELEKIVKLISEKRGIWYATCDEAYEYIKAQKELVVSEDEQCFYNPTATDVWIRRDRIETMCIPAGRKMNLKNVY